MPSIYYEKMTSFLDRSRKDLNDYEFKSKLLSTYKMNDEELKDRMYALAEKLGSGGSFYQVLYIFELLYSLLSTNKESDG